MAKLDLTVSHPPTFPEKPFHNRLLMPPLFHKTPPTHPLAIFMQTHICFAHFFPLNAQTQQYIRL